MCAIKNLFSTVIVGVFSLIETSQASVVVLDFEGLQDHESVQEYYNGGTGSSGSSYGSNINISFSTNALAIIDADAGGTGEFANEPSADTVLHWHTGSDVTINAINGFDTGFSFFYASYVAANVDVYDGLNGTGNLIASFDLVAQGNNNCTGDPNGNVCNWTPVGISFNGIAYSVRLGGTADLIAYDNITIGSASVVPIPSAVWLFGSGLLGMFGMVRSKIFATRK